MPRKATHFYSSAHAAKAERESGSSTRQRPLRPYYCSSTGVHVLTTDADVDDERSPLPRRRTDGALVLDESKHVVKLYLVEGGTKVLTRRGGVRERQLRLCVACEAGNDVGRGAAAAMVNGDASTSTTSTTTSTQILLPVAYRTDARSSLIYILPGALTSLAGGGVLSEDALAAAAGLTENVGVGGFGGGVTTLSSSNSQSTIADKRRLAALSRQQAQRFLPPPSCVLPLRGGGSQASIVMFQQEKKEDAPHPPPRFVSVNPDSFVFAAAPCAAASRFPSAEADEQALEAARVALGCRRSQLAMQKGAVLTVKRKRDEKGGQGTTTATATLPRHCHRLLLVTGILPLAVFEKLSAACVSK